jgi:hypothetical protein
MMAIALVYSLPPIAIYLALRRVHVALSECIPRFDAHRRFVDVLTVGVYAAPHIATTPRRAGTVVMDGDGVYVLGRLRPFYDFPRGPVIL